MTFRLRIMVGCAALLAFPAERAIAQAPPSVATISACPLSNGVTIAPCRVAFRTFGRLNAAKDNAVLVPTWLLGRSEDWLPLLGPAGIIDTTAFFTIVVDALGNGRSQSPSNTPSPQRAAFDALTIGNMVESQYRLLTEHFGIAHLHAVVGISMGGMQTFEWTVRYPTFVGRAVSIVGSPRIGTYDDLLWTTIRMAIDNGMRGRLAADSIWAQVVHMLTLHFSTPHATNQQSVDSLAREMAGQVGFWRASWTLDDFRAQLGALLRHDVAAPYRGDLTVAAARVQAPLLTIYSWDDQMVTAGSTVPFGRLVNADSLVVASPCGHGLFVCEATRVGAATRAFLAR